jgi:ribosomal protein L37AE/L43A
MSQELITISRAGAEIGKFPEADLLKLVEQKQILPTDHYWKAGMSDWRLVSELVAVLKAAQARVEAEAARAKQEADAQAKAKQAELEAWAKAEADRRAAKLIFTCHCCKVVFPKPFDPESETRDGVIDVFIGSFLVFIPIIGWIFVPYFILRGLAKAIASRVKSPHCPNCRSTNFSRQEGSDKPLF